MAHEKKKSDNNESDAKKLDDEKTENEKYQAFVAQFPQAALAVYMRELEVRFLNVLANLAKKPEERVTAYAKVCKAQASSKLHNTVYDMKDQLKANNFPALSSKTLVARVKKLGTTEGDKLSAASSSQEKPRSILKSPASSRRSSPAATSKSALPATSSRKSSPTRDTSKQGKGKGKGKSKDSGKGKGKQQKDSKSKGKGKDSNGKGKKGGRRVSFRGD